jgi:hypothetical protein
MSLNTRRNARRDSKGGYTELKGMNDDLGGILAAFCFASGTGNPNTSRQCCRLYVCSRSVGHTYEECSVNSSIFLTS